MDSKKIKQTIMVAFFVSLSAQLHFDFFSEGFIVALSSVVMAIFIYCYVDLSSTYIIILSGIFSPFFRLIVEYIGSGNLIHTLYRVFPDMVFFFCYAAVFTLIYKFIIKMPKNMRNFPFAVFFCDMLSNTVELLVRSLMSQTILISPDTCMLLALIAFLRTAIIMMVIIAIEAYGNFLINKEHDEEYKRLLTQASAVEGEMRVMSKNVKDVESVMKKAYDLYNYSTDENYPKEISDKLLEIAKETHEIKGAYQNVLGVLNNTFLGNMKDEKLYLSEIIHLERSNVLAMAKKHGYKVQITTKIAYDCNVNETFKLMSVIRNLMTNACEAIGAELGKIVVSVMPVYKDPKELKVQPDFLEIRVKDDGPGIPKEEIDNIFLEGYSTKFNPETGNIERGLGLCLVKDYVENDFGGRLEIASEVGKFTEFTLLLPFSNFSNFSN